MKLIDSEVLTVASGETVTLTRSKIDNDSGPNAVTAVITNHDLGDCEVGFRIGDTPDEATHMYRPIVPSESVQVDGYENLRDVRFILIGTVSAKLFIEYFA